MQTNNSYLNIFKRYYFLPGADHADEITERKAANNNTNSICDLDKNKGGRLDKTTSLIFPLKAFISVSSP